MQRILNFTGRKKIEKKEALFSFADVDSDIPEFNVLFSFDATAYPADSSLYVEAHHAETRQRFYFGKVSRIVPAANRKLDQIDLSGPTLFTVLVVDETGKHGLLLARGDDFRADGDGDNNEDRKSSLLSVVKRPLGQLTWKVEFDTGGMPELCLNSGIPNGLEKMRSDPLFQSLILPAALREVLIYYLWNDEDSDNEDYLHWMTFANSLADPKPENSDPVALMNWVAEVVDAFSNRFDLTDRLANASREEG